MEFFIQVSLIVGVTIFFAFLAKFLKQPLIISYIASGIVVGPYFLNLVESYELLDVFSRMGIALLLFVVGLGLNPKVIKEVGKVSLITGVGQVLFTSIIGFVISVMLGFDLVSSFYIAIALTFSSTIIIMKLLTDRGDTETLYGKIAIGFLIVQDLIAMFLLLIITAIPSGEGLFNVLPLIIVKGILLIIFVFIIGFKVLPKLMDFISKSQEFLLLFSLGWCFVLAAVFQTVGFSMEIGALLAGFTLALSPYRFEVSSKLRVIRDFFLVLFFIGLGAQLMFGNIQNFIIPIIVFSTFILVGNPLIVIILMGFMGYTKRNSFLAGLTVAQISEFSIILVVLGIKMGHLSQDLLLLITSVGLITIAGSSYMILYSEKIYPFFEKFLTIFERKNIINGNKEKNLGNYDCILFGCNRIGYDVLKAFDKTNSKYFVVEYDPQKVKDFEKKGIEVVYGDSSDSDFIDELPLKKTKMIVSTIPDFNTNLMLLEKVNKINKNIISILISYHADDAIKLYEEGASYVIIPHFLGGHYTATLIETHGTDFNKFLAEKMKHLNYLNQRKKNAPEHFNYEIK